MPTVNHPKSRAKEYTIAIIFSCIGAPIMAYISCSSCYEDFNKYLTVASVSTLMWAVMWIGNSELTHQIDKIVSWVEYPLKRFFVGLASTIILTVCVSIGLLKVWEYGRGIRFGSYYDFILISLIITFLISLFLHGRVFLLQWKKSAVEAERYQKESIAAQYESLRSQVNPHFLFNSLNVLTNLVYEDQDKAAEFIRKMSEVYRYVLDTRGKELVDLSEEMKFVSSYLYLQQIRFGTNLRIDNRVQGIGGKVIPLAIQMLIENAIKHNEVSADKPLEISLWHEGAYICVQNKIQKRSSASPEDSGLGLENIRKRYAYLAQHSVEVMENENFVVKIPLLSQTEYD